MMKAFRYLMVTVTALLAPLICFAASPGDVNLRLVEGDVQVKTEDTRDWVPAAPNMPLLEKDMIWVPEDGKAEVQLANGSIVRLGSETFFEVTSARQNGFGCYLGEGHAYINVRGLGGYDVVVSTPGGPFRGYNGAVYRVDVDRDGDVEASALSGNVYTESGTAEMRINVGERLVLARDGGGQMYRVTSSDPWERWNRQRDQELFDSAYATNGPSHLPDELKPYANDLNRNGRWVQTPEYGYAWTPTAGGGDAWAPYRVGRWVWIGGDYVWVSYEPWGWAPYHYGRWAHLRQIGWCWVPPPRGSVHWAPGYVAWVHRPKYVAWVPLAPRETYYGRGHHGPHSVNISDVNVNRTLGSNVNLYRNIHVRNAVTTIHHDQLARGKPMPMPAIGNPFLKEPRIMPAPIAKPDKGAMMAIVKEVPSRNLPPQRVRDIKVGDIGKQYPGYKNPMKSGQVRLMPGQEKPVTKGPGHDRSGEQGRNPINDRKPLEKIQAIPAKDARIMNDSHRVDEKPVPMPLADDKRSNAKTQNGSDEDMKSKKGVRGEEVKPVPMPAVVHEKLKPVTKMENGRPAEGQLLRKSPAGAPIPAREIPTKPAAVPRADPKVVYKGNRAPETPTTPVEMPQRVERPAGRNLGLSSQRPGMSDQVPVKGGQTSVNKEAHIGNGAGQKMKQGDVSAEQLKRGQVKPVEAKREPEDRPLTPANPSPNMKHRQESGKQEGGVREAHPNDGPKGGGARSGLIQGHPERPN